MIAPILHPEKIVVVMTDFGPYTLHPSETAAFMHVYAGERGKSDWMRKWEEELIDYATEQKRSEWLAG